MALDVRDVTRAWNGVKTIPPMVMAIMRAENTHPVGTPPGGFCDKRVGTHINTN